MSIPAPVVEAKMNGAWVDLSAWVDLAAQPIKISRGRADEQAEPDAGTCSFVLVNDDGRFTIENATSPLYPYWQEWVEIRVTVSGSRRYTGFVTASVESWPGDGENSKLARVEVSCTDLMGVLAQSPTVRSWTSELIADLSPLHWWTLSDAPPATTAQPSAGTATLMGAVNAGGYVDPATGSVAVDPSGVLAFGQAGGSESDTQVQLKITQSGEGTTFARAEATLSCNLQAGMPSEFTVLLVYTPTEPQGGREVVWRIAQTGGIFIRVEREGADLVFVQGATEKLREPWFFVPPYPKQFLIAVQVTATKVRLVNTGHEYDRTLGALGSALFVLGPSEGLYSQAAICDGLVEDWQVFDLEARVLGGESLPVTEWLGRATGEAGISSAVVATTDRPMLRPQLKGSNPASIGTTLAAASGSLWVASRAGVPTWIDSTYLPAVVSLDGAMFSLAGLRRASNRGLRYTEVAVDGVTQASTAAGWPRRALDVPGLLPEGGPREQYVAWLAGVADIAAKPRLSGLEFDLLTLDAATVATVLGLDLRSRINVPNPPLPQIPQPLIMTVEGYSETVGLTEWSLAINTAPDPRFVLGTTPAGVLGSNYRLL